MELDEDVLFADLSKQIALLIMDDDELISQETCPTYVSPVQGFPYAYQGASVPPPHLNYGQSLYIRESKGTGVFIPRSTAPRMKYNRSSTKLKLGSRMNTGSYRQQMDKFGGNLSDIKEAGKPITSKNYRR